MIITSTEIIRLGTFTGGSLILLVLSEAARRLLQFALSPPSRSLPRAGKPLLRAISIISRFP
jgi:hypothetical protein